MEGWPLEFDWLEGQTFDAGGKGRSRAEGQTGRMVPKTVTDVFSAGRVQGLKSRSSSAKQAVVKELRQDESESPFHSEFLNSFHNETLLSDHKSRP